MNPNRKSLVAWLLGALLLLAHALLVLRAYPIGFLLRGDVPLKGDVPRYFATAAAVAETGGLFGYDPYNMAGYPAGLWNSMGKKGYEVLHLLLPWIPLPQLFYLTLVGLTLACPLVLWLALRRHCGTAVCRGILFVLTLVVWHLSTDISYFWNFGNIFFPAASCALVLMVVLLGRLLEARRRWIAALALGVTAAAVFYAHTVALAAAVVPLLAVVLAAARGRVQPGLTARASGALALAAAVFSLLVVWWVVPLAQTQGDCLPQPKAWFQGGPKELVMDVFSDRAYQHPFDRNALYHLVVVAGLAGTLLVTRQLRSSTAPPVLLALGLGGVAALAITYVGFTIPAMRSIQPYRFTIPATLLLLGPAAVFIEAGWDAVRRSPPAVRATVIALLLVLMPAFTGYLIDLTWPRDGMAIPAGQQAVMDALRARPVKGRVLTDDAALGHILPTFNRVAVLGGLSTQAFLKHRFAGIDEDGIGFGRRAEDWTPATLRPYLAAYGVEYAVFSTPAWRRLAAGPESPFALEQAIGGTGIYRVQGGDPDLVLSGEADVVADYRGIVVSNVAQSPLVLKLHYASWLTAGPGVRLEPEMVLDDPVPFLRAVVDPGVKTFLIHKGP